MLLSRLLNWSGNSALIVRLCLAPFCSSSGFEVMEMQRLEIVYMIALTSLRWFLSSCISRSSRRLRAGRRLGALLCTSLINRPQYRC